MGVLVTGVLQALTWFAAVAGLAALARRRPLDFVPRVMAWLERPVCVVLAGTASALLTLHVFGSASEVPTFHDEQALVLQARLFAQGRWTGDPVPIPEFFEQAHVFVEPRVAGKYPPGHSLALVPGVWLNRYGLGPIVESGLTGACIYWLAVRAGGGAVGLLVWLLWSTSAIGLFWRASYFSQGTSGLLFVALAVCAVQWRAHRRFAHLVIAFVLIGAMYLTRPLTALALGGVIGAGLARDVVAAGRWRQLVAATVALCGVLSLNLLWHSRVTGNAMVSPYALYSRLYMPSEKPGFGLDRSPPLRPVSSRIRWLVDDFRQVHEQHTLPRLPLIALQRVGVLVMMVGEGWRLILGALFLIGLVRSPRSRDTRAAAATVVAVVAAYLVYAHPLNWTLYYSEVLPAMIFIAVIEFRLLLQSALHLPQQKAAGVLLASALVAMPFLYRDVSLARRSRDVSAQGHRMVASLLATVPDRRLVVFVRYPAGHNHHASIVGNALGDSDRVWLVHDLGAENVRLLARVKDRAPYILDVGKGTLVPYEAANSNAQERLR